MNTERDLLARKKLFAITLTGLLFTGMSPTGLGAADASSSSNSLAALSNDAKQSLAQVQQSRQNYLATVKQYGDKSPQAQAAKSQLDSARATWQGKMVQVRQARQAARAQLMQQRQQRIQEHRQNNRNIGP